MVVKLPELKKVEPIIEPPPDVSLQDLMKGLRETLSFTNVAQESLFPANELSQAFADLGFGAGWTVKLTPGQKTFGLSIITPQGWEITEDNRIIVPALASTLFGQELTLDSNLLPPAERGRVVQQPPPSVTMIAATIEQFDAAVREGIIDLPTDRIEPEFAQTELGTIPATGSFADLAAFVERVTGQVPGIGDFEDILFGEVPQFETLFPQLKEQGVEDVIAYFFPEVPDTDVGAVPPAERERVGKEIILADIRFQEFVDAIRKVGRTPEALEFVGRLFPAATEQQIDELFGGPEFVEENWIKDFILDPFYVGGVEFVHGIRRTFTSVLPTLLAGAFDFISEIAPGQRAEFGEDISRNIIKDAEEQFTRLNREHQQWIEDRPELAPNPDYNKNPFDNTELFSDPGYYAYTISNSLVYSLSVLGTIAATTAVTGGNLFVGLGAGLVVAGAPEASNMTQELMDMGVPFEEATRWGILYGTAVGGIETVSNLPFLGIVFKPVKQATKPFWNTLMRLTANRIARTAIVAGVLPTVEGIEEAITQATHNAIIMNYDNTQSLVEDMDAAFIQGVIASLPFAAIGGGASYKSFKEALPPAIETQLDTLTDNFVDAGASEEDAQVMAVNEIAKTPEGEAAISEALEVAKVSPEAAPRAPIVEIVPAEAGIFKPGDKFTTPQGEVALDIWVSPERKWAVKLPDGTETKMTVAELDKVTDPKTGTWEKIPAEVEAVAIEAEEAVAEVEVLEETIKDSRLRRLLPIWKRIQRRKDRPRDLTIREYKKFTGKSTVPPTSLTTDKKHVSWEDALDSVVTEFGYETTEELMTDLEKLGGMATRLERLGGKVPPAGKVLPSRVFSAETLAAAIPNTLAAGAPLNMIRLSDIAKQLAEKLNVVIRRGKFRGKSRGIFKVGKEIIRIKGGQISTIAHEVGHLLDERYNLSKDLTKTEIDALLVEYPDPKNKRIEAFGEFMRYFITNPSPRLNVAKDLAPSFYKTFLGFLDGNKDVANALYAARDDFARWVLLPSTAKVASQINTDPPQANSSLKDTMNRLYTAAWDALYPIRDFVKTGEKAGIKLEAGEDPYLLSRLMKGEAGKSNVFLEKGTFGRVHWTVEKGEAKMLYKGKGLREILKPIKDSLDNFRLYLVSRRAVQLAGRDIETGINPNDARQAIKELEAQYPSFEAVAEEIYTYQRQLLEYARESGLISQETLDKLAEKSKDYIPFYRIMEDIQAGGFYGKGFVNIRDGIKRIRGSERDIVDPLESIVKNTYALMDAADRNQVGIMMARLAEKDMFLSQSFEEIPTPMAKVAQVTASDLGIKLEGLSESETETVFNVFRPSMFSGKDNVVSVVIDGKRTYYQTTPELYRAISAMEREDLGLLIKALSYPAKWLRAGAILNPDFWLGKNPVRDTFTAFVYSKYGFIPFVDTIRGTFEYFNKGDLYDLWRASGGERSMMVSLDREYLQQSFDEVVNKRRPLSYVKHPLDTLQRLAEFTESGTRISEFRRGIKKGVSPLEAGLAAREVTLDFQVIGAKTRSWNMITAFFNSNMRGMDKLAREAMQRPLNFFPKIIMGIMIPSILLYLANRDDERWKEIPQWEKDLFWIFFIGDEIIRIPKPFEVGILFGSVPERIMEYIDTEDPNAIREVLDNLISSMNPGLIPTGLLPLIENWANYNFFLERPVVPASEEGLPPELQYSIYTPEMIKKWGDWLNYSPRKIENLLSGYTAGLGRYAIDALDGILRKVGILPDPVMPTPELKDVPVIGGLIARNPYGSGSASVTRFYDELEKITSYEQALKQFIKQGDEAKYNEYLKDHPQTMFQFDYELGSFYSASARYLREVSRELSDLRSKEQEIFLSPDLTGDEKRELIDEIDKLISDTARLALEYLKTMPAEFNEDGSSPVAFSKINYYEFVGELPKFLRDYYMGNSIEIDENIAEGYTKALIAQDATDEALINKYYTDTQGEKSGVKYEYRADNPEIDAALNFWGRVTTLRSDAARNILKRMADKYNIPYAAFKALSSETTGPGTTTTPAPTTPTAPGDLFGL